MKLQYCHGCVQCFCECYPAQLFVLECQHPCALCKQFHLDSRQRVCGGEVPLGPPAERHNKTLQRLASMTAQGNSVPT